MKCLYKEVKRILLIDGNVRQRKLRATVLRGYEFEVHAAANLLEATQVWKAIAYDLVLLADPQNMESAAWITQIRGDKPGQRIGLLVGPPSYIEEVARPAKSEFRQRRRFDAIPLPVAAEPAGPQWQEAISTL